MVKGRGPNTFFCMQLSSRCQYHSLKDSPFLIELFWHPCQKPTEHQYKGLFLGPSFYSIQQHVLSYTSSTHLLVTLNSLGLQTTKLSLFFPKLLSQCSFIFFYQPYIWDLNLSIQQICLIQMSHRRFTHYVSQTELFFLPCTTGFLPKSYHHNKWH